MTDETTRTASAERGETTLVLDGETLGLRPSFEAIEEIELTLDRGLVDIARDAIDLKLKLGAVAQIVCALVRAFGRATGNKGAAGANPKRIGRLILESDGGMLIAQKQLSGLLSVAVTGGYDSEGNPKPTTMTTTEEAPVVG
ncbi:GTA-gp10 family protein [Sphingomonas sp. 2378]|uniref:GTA-gp10 family protein n=1 Tax=Sphingomonas sp. 2378 TaxID=1219748 RepID=UPI00311B2FF9